MNTELITEISDETLARAAEIIRGGGLVVFPTETVYGLGANALLADAAKNIYSAKGRPSDNPLIIHLACPEDAEKYCNTCELYYKLAKAYMPGPLTVILPKKDIIPDVVTGGLDTVAVRVPSDRTARRLIELSGVPIAAPSANLSGRPSPTCAAHVVQDLFGRVDAIIDGGECVIGLESTVVKVDGDRITLLRPGAITPEHLLKISDKLTFAKEISTQSDEKPLSPGMKYKHYAPRAPVTMLDGEDGAVYRYLKDYPDAAVICFDKDEKNINCKTVLTMGERADSAAQAHRVFALLRTLDDIGAEKIFVRMPAKDGIGLAVYNRLIKAAGYNIISL